ncbi:MAG: phosphotransferase [Prevotellaceae bacterium]|nr:phosphotransferase [Prevotellaceae bacterium]
MIKTAVILTARKERDSGIPYPLQPFDGNICLIDRTITLLSNNGFKHIIIVVGFQDHLFEKYASELVNIVKAPNYKYTASMASLAAAKDIIHEDFVLIEGDTFYEAKVLEALSNTSHKNCLAITEESGSGDEAFVETEQGFITKISKDKHQLCNFEGELMGICKISYETYQRMIQRWSVCSNLLMNYEYMFMDCTSVLERPYLWFKNLIWGEVDKREDFDKLCNYIYPRLRRKENPFDYANLVSHLHRIFPNVDVGESVVIEQIGGLSNKNFKVTIHDKEYVLRVPGIGSEGMVVRSFEEQNSLQGCMMGISPNIAYFDEKTGIKLTDYIHNAETLNPATIQRKDNLIQIVSIYKKLHHSNVRFNNDFNIFYEIHKYESLMEKSKGIMYDGYDNIRTDIFSMESRLNELGVLLAPCHNDAVPENFIKSGDGKVYIIDWEYSGMNDPMWEFAALFIESDFSEDSQDFFLDCYYQGNVPLEAKEKILIYEFLMDMLWSIWTVVKETQGDNLGTYGIDRFNRGLATLKILKNNRKLTK